MTSWSFQTVWRMREAWKRETCSVSVFFVRVGSQISPCRAKKDSNIRQGLSQAAPLRQSRTSIGIVRLKNGQGDNLSPSQFREKTRKQAHTKRFISVQKLQAETERGSMFYRTFKVHSKVTLQSHSTAIFVGNLRQGFWFFPRSRSREIHKNTKNTAKFGRNLIKYMSVKHIWNLFQL